jgi:type II secretory pathway component GspD/PulD (secretin)
MKRVKINKIGFIISLIALSFMQACVSDEVVLDEPVVIKKVAKKPALAIKQETLLVELGKHVSLKNLRAAKKQKSKQKLTNFVTDVWLGDSSVKIKRGQANLPRRLTRFHDLTFIAPAMSLTEMANALSATIETPIQVIEGNRGKIKLVDKKPIHYKGKMADLLDMFATNFDAVWRYDRYKHRIIFERVLTKELDFSVGAGTERVIKKISARNGADNSFSTDRQILLDPWQELKRDLEKLMPAGSVLSLSPSMGKIVITTTPSALRRAVRLIRTRNKNLQRQIYFNVQLIELTIPEEKLNRGNLPLSLVGLLSQASEGKLLINGKAQNKGSVTSIRPENKKPLTTPSSAGRPSGTSMDAVLEALGKIGELSVLTSASSWTLNGKAIPVRKTSQQSYVSQVDSGKFIPAKIETSFYLHLLPLILPRERVQVDLSVALKSLNAMRNYGVGDNQIQLPQTSTKTWTQEAIIPDGATLLLSGFEVRRSVSGSHVMMIILITPQILQES